MKRILFISGLIILLSNSVFSYEGDVKAGLQFISSVYDYGFTFSFAGSPVTFTIKEFEDMATYMGLTASVETSTAVPALEADIGNRLNDNFVYCATFMYVPNIIYRASYYQIGLKALDQSIDFSLFYIGLGGKFQFFPGDTLSLFLSADAGYMMTYASMTNKLYDMSGNVINTSSSTASGSRFGFSAGAGMKYYFTDTVYATIESGYNYTGASVFAVAGIGLDLTGRPGKAGAASKTHAAAPSPSGTGGGDKYLKYGDYYYGKGDYKNAYKYYKAAFAADKNAINSAKTGQALLKLGYKKQAIAYLKYSLKLEENEDIRNLVDQLSAE